MDWKSVYAQKIKKGEEAVKAVQPGDGVYIGTTSSMAYVLIDELWKRRRELSDITINSTSLLRSCDFTYGDGEYSYRMNSCFCGKGERQAIKSGILDFTSVHLSQVDIWCKQTAKPSVCFFDVSLPDENGYMSYGPSGIGLNNYFIGNVRNVVVQVNKQTPYVYGESNLIHVSQVDAIVEVDELTDILDVPEIDDETGKLSQFIIEQIPDGATIQLGLGKLSTAIGLSLDKKNDLGVHSEMMNDSIMYLMNNGNITNAGKGFLNGKSVFAFALGSEDLYKFINYNEKVYGAPYPFVNNPVNISKNKRMISINTAMAIDLFGQVAADSIGWKQQSGTGGQLDFVRGAQMSEEGKSFIAATSSFIKDGHRISRIVVNLPVGTAVTTPRSDVQYVATEYGCVNLKVLNMSDRVRAMISLAHPDFRNQLTDEAKKYNLI